MTLDEEIKRFEKLASDYEFNLNMHKNHVMNLSVNDIERMQEYLEENRQLAEWLKKLLEYEEAEEEINRKMRSGQWSDAVVYGMSKASVIIKKCRFAHNCKEVNAE